MATDRTTGQTAESAEAGLSPEELEGEVAIELPDREALSIAFPLGVAVTPTAAAKGAATAAQAAEEAPLAEGP